MKVRFLACLVSRPRSFSGPKAPGIRDSSQQSGGCY